MDRKMSESCVVIVAALCKDAVVPTDTLEERLEKALRKAYENGVVWDEDHILLGSVAAVMTEASDDEKEQIKCALHGMKILNALITGVPVDFDAAMLEYDASPAPIGRVYRKVRGEREVARGR